MTNKIWVECELGYDIVLIDNFNHDATPNPKTKEWRYFIETKINNNIVVLWESWDKPAYKQNNFEEIQYYIVTSLINAIKNNITFVSIPKCIGQYEKLSIEEKEILNSAMEEKNSK
jgi:hypothetical protein